MKPFKPLTISITSKALFDLRTEDKLFKAKGLNAYRAYQRRNEAKILKPGTGYGLVKGLSSLVHPVTKEPLFRIVLVSQNDSESSLRILNSIVAHKINIRSAAFTGGKSQVPYIRCYQSDLFLSTNATDVYRVWQGGCAAASLYESHYEQEIPQQIRFAFDGDCVLFDDASEKVFRTGSMAKYEAYEKKYAATPLGRGPFQPFLAKLHAIQKLFPAADNPIRTALVTARSIPTHERPITTLRHWGIHVDELFFLGGQDKSLVLQEFKPHIFFDDREEYCRSASSHVPTGRVPTLAPLAPVTETKPSR
jgi:5'-nucleotidase